MVSRSEPPEDLGVMAPDCIRRESGKNCTLAGAHGEHGFRSLPELVIY